MLIQRGYGKERGKWSLPGGFVDAGERSKHAAYRETKEETGLVVKVVSMVMINRDGTAKVFAGRVVGGKLYFQRRECLDVRFRDPSRMKNHDLAFDSDRRALRLWADMKEQHTAPFLATMIAPAGEGGDIQVHWRGLEIRGCTRERS